MKYMKRHTKRMVLLLVLFAYCVVSYRPVKARADEDEVKASMPRVLVESYRVVDKLVPGKEFQLVLELKNYGSTTAKNLMVNVANPRGVTPVYGTVTQSYIGDLAPGASKEVSFQYDSYTTITADYIEFSVSLVADNHSNYVDVDVPVSKDSPFSVTAVNGPDNVRVGEKATYSVSFKVLGEENLSDVSVLLSVDGQAVSTSTIGILTPGTTKSQSISTQFREPGLYNVEQVITYRDSAGITQMTVANTIKVSVTEAEEVTNPEITPTEPPKADNSFSILNSTSFTLVLLGMMLLVIFFIVVILVRKRNK